jgi:predicted nucleic-acid-binding protein
LKISVDTNVLVRFVVRDDEIQWLTAVKILQDAEVVAVSMSSLCELVWVLKKSYRFGREEISAVLYTLLDTANVVVNSAAVEAGLAILKAGGDFADGVIAYEGRMLGGETFLSFDREAVSLTTSQGQQAMLLS